MKRFARILVHFPYLILSITLIISIICLAVILTVGEWPDFSDPRLGFEARGTEIGKRMLSYSHLIKNTDYFIAAPNQKSQTRTVRDTSGIIGPNEEGRDNNPEDEHGFYNNTGEVNYFCDIPRVEYAQVVFTHMDGESLFTHRSIQAMCEIENSRLRSTESFQEICIHKLSSRECCRSWSLGNYIAHLSNKTSCLDLSPFDVDEVLRLLVKCSGYFHNGTLTPYCGPEDDLLPGCQIVPPECRLDNTVYHIFHYLTDTEFLQSGSGTGQNDLKYSVTFLPVAAGIGTKPFYREIQDRNLEQSNVKLIAMNFGVKENLFYYHLRKDAVWLAVACASIFLLMWIYTCSIFITAMTLASMIMSLVIAYFLYTFVYNIDFFPFKNLLAIVILLGIGADDVFVYTHIWKSAKQKKDTRTLQQIVSDTIKHATLSMFVTSLTTSAAFFASFISKITAVCCFALFAGTVVMTNFVVMMTWIPATIIIKEKWTSHCTTSSGSSDCSSETKTCLSSVSSAFHRAHSWISHGFRYFFETILPIMIGKVPYLWLILLGALGIGGVVVTFYHPKLRLPSSNDFQVFSSDHPFEVYDFVVKDHLWFGKSTGSLFAHMPLIVVWGVKAIDNGNKLDPFDDGTIQYEQHFNIATPESQLWLRNFCRHLRSHELYQREFGLHLTDCFIEPFIQFMKRGCRGFDEKSLAPCCGNPPFPYSEETFSQCIQQWLPLLEKDNPFYTINKKSGLRFTRDKQNLVSLIVYMTSKQSYSMNYHAMQTFYTTMNTWVTTQMRQAPDGLGHGWFISDLEFFDLQDTIAQGTPIAIAVAISIAFLVTFMTTLNIVITLYAILSISLAIFTTIGVLILLGWELNILEAVTMSVAAGLSIDFTLHYGVAYALIPSIDRTARVTYAASCMGSPVGMAALTTFLAGALVMPSTVLAYRQLGTFLMLVMATSWVYGTMFFLPLLWVLGPQAGFGQVHSPSCFSSCSSCDKRHTHVDKTTYAMSETASSSPNLINSSPQSTELEELNEDEEAIL